MNPKLIRPTKAEDAAITAGAYGDPDNQPLTETELAQFKRARGQRGPNKDPRKVPLTIRVQQDVVERWRATGEGWQTRMADAMARYSPESATGREPKSVWHDALSAFAAGRRDFKPQALTAMLTLGLLQFRKDGNLEVSPYGRQELTKVA